MKIAYNVEYLVIFSMPTSALGLPGHTKHWHGQSGHLPIKNYEGMGKVGMPLPITTAYDANYYGIHLPSII